MKNKIIYPAQMSTQSLGRLTVSVIQDTGLIPIPDAVVRITPEGEPTRVVAEVTTDEIGRTEAIELEAPPEEYSLEPESPMPYSEYTITASAPNFDQVEIHGAQILPNVTAVQPVELIPIIEEDPYAAHAFNVEPHTLYGEYPPKIAEDEIKPIDETGEIVLREVVVPEFVIVHDGVPTDSSAPNYYVRYNDYIKNVASSEIYATWPESAIYANVLAIMSFTLNRVYTEWYRNQGYNFTITSSTAFDHKWMSGRNIYSNISLIVDTIFNNYLSRPNVSQPILTQYCDGNRVTCPGWLSQWGSKNLADQGYDAIDIIRNYYGSNMFINEAPAVAGVPSSFPGFNLDIGASGDYVRQLQDQLNTIAAVYTAIPRIAVDGIYGPNTKKAVEEFQRIFGLPANGIVDLPTWYRISHIYVAVTRIAE
ncbi:MAG: peptidoglycan-binding protein [Clostridiales bacterium]|nr:peptidoglycan-binding protein [Clostridiales bacterium]